jgi:hypothetical protein
MFKIIISPEDGASVDFRAASRDMIRALEQRAGERLEWAGIVHRNTEHPHAHIILRGRTQSGDPLFIQPKVIRAVLRDEVQRSLTRQLGPRTVADIERQRRSEITAFRVTNVDRHLAKQVGRKAPGVGFTASDEMNVDQYEAEKHLPHRLATTVQVPGLRGNFAVTQSTDLRELLINQRTDLRKDTYSSSRMPRICRQKRVSKIASRQTARRK